MSWLVDALGMKRIKRFVLAENSEKDPIWKSSDNLMASLSRMNSFETQPAGQLPDAEAASDAKPRQESRLSVPSVHHGMT